MKIAMLIAFFQSRRNIVTPALNECALQLRLANGVRNNADRTIRIALGYADLERA